MSFFHKTSVGRVINRICLDILEIDDDLAYFMNNFLNEFISSISYPIVIIINLP